MGDTGIRITGAAASSGNPSPYFVDLFNNQTAMGTKTWVIPHIDGPAEALGVWRLDEDTTSQFRIENNTISNNSFQPCITGVNSAANTALTLLSRVGSDSGTGAAMVFQAMTNAGATISVRPVFDWWNNSVRLSQMLADGSQWWNTTPASLAAGRYSVGTRRAYTATTTFSAGGVFEAFGNPGSSSSGTYAGALGYASSNTANAQAFTTVVGVAGLMGQAEHRGTATVTGQSAVYAFGNLNSGGGTVTNNYGLYVAAQTVGTNNWGIYSASLIEGAGGRFSGTNTSSVAGGAIELLHTGTAGSINSYDRNAASWKVLSLQANSIGLAPNGSTKFLVDANRAAFSNGVAYTTNVVTAAGPNTIGVNDIWSVANPTVTAAAIYNLPGSPAAGEEHTITDAKGIAGANTITIQGNGKTINGAASITMTANYGSRTVRYNGTEWNVVASV